MSAIPPFKIWLDANRKCLFDPKSKDPIALRSYRKLIKECPSPYYVFAVLGTAQAAYCCDAKSLLEWKSNPDYVPQSGEAITQLFWYTFNPKTNTYSLLGEGNEQEKQGLFQHCIYSASSNPNIAATYMLILGDDYLRGNGVEKCPKMAFDCFCKAADGGILEAWLKVGMCYLEGIGIEKNLLKAFEAFSKATEGIKEAWVPLGKCYEEGIGVEKNSQLAFECYRNGADAGDEDAKAEFDRCCEASISTAEFKERGNIPSDSSLHTSSQPPPGWCNLL